MAKVAIFAKMIALPGKLDELVEAAEALVATAGVEPGTEVYTLNVARDQGVLWFYELYTDADAVAAHSQSDRMKEFGAKLAELAEPKPEVHLVTPLAAKGLNVS
jgi:quinol monooxygenase YgiN